MDIDLVRRWFVRDALDSRVVRQGVMHRLGGGGGRYMVARRCARYRLTWGWSDVGFAPVRVNSEWDDDPSEPDQETKLRKSRWKVSFQHSTSAVPDATYNARAVRELAIIWPRLATRQPCRSQTNSHTVSFIISTCFFRSRRRTAYFVSTLCRPSWPSLPPTTSAAFLADWG